MICELVVGIYKLPMVWETTFRGISNSYVINDPTFFDGCDNNKIIRWDGMNSTSLKREVAKKFAETKKGFEMEGYH